jgi:hypothetical protein
MQENYDALILRVPWNPDAAAAQGADRRVKEK